MEGTSDFGSTDNNNYMESLNAFTSSIALGQASVADINKLKKEKVDQFNNAIQAPLTALATPFIEKGVSNLSKAIKRNIRKTIGDSTERVQQQISQGRDNLNSLAQRGQTIADDVTQRTGRLGETELDDMIGERGEASAAAQAGRIVNNEGENAFDRIFGSAPYTPEGAEEAQRLASRGVQQSVNTAVQDIADKGVEGATDGAKVAGKAVAEDAGKVILKEGEDEAVSTGVKVAASVATDTAVAEGGLNPVADLASVGLGLGMLFTGLFAKKHLHETPPPPAVNPSVQFGV